MKSPGRCLWGMSVADKKHSLLMDQLGRDRGKTPSALNNEDLHIMGMIPLLWQPAPEILKKLLALGYSEHSLSAYRDLFVLWAREKRLLFSDPDKVFERYCLNRKKSSSTQTPMAQDWIPRLSTIEMLMGQYEARIETIIDSMASFTNYSSGRFSSDWDDDFTRWVTRKIESDL